MSVQESKNGLCNKPCLNGRQAQALRAILTCCDSNVLFTSRCLHTNLTPAACGNGFAEFSSGHVHFRNHISFNKGSALLSTTVKTSCFRTGLWEQTSRSGVSTSSSTFPHPIEPLPVSTHRQEQDKQQDVEVDWKCPAIKNDNFCIFVL